MAEFNLIIDNKELNYSGIFSVDDLLQKINQLLDQRGYQRVEKKSEETVTPEGKEFYLELRPFKAQTNYMRLWLKIKLHLTKVTDVTKEVQGRKRLFQQGDVHLVLDAWVMTDYEDRFGRKSFIYFLKAVINKYLYKFPLEEKFLREVGSDGMFLFTDVQNYLENYVYQTGIREKERLAPITTIPLERERRKR